MLFIYALTDRSSFEGFLRCSSLSFGLGVRYPLSIAVSLVGPNICVERLLVLTLALETVV